MLEAWLDVFRPAGKWRPPLEIRGIVAGAAPGAWLGRQARHPGTSLPSPRSCCAPSPCSNLFLTLDPAVPLGSRKLVLLSWRGSRTLREKGEKPEAPSPWLQRAKGCLGGDAGFPWWAQRQACCAPAPPSGSTWPAFALGRRGRSSALLVVGCNALSIKNKFRKAKSPFFQAGAMLPADDGCHQRGDFGPWPWHTAASRGRVSLLVGTMTLCFG